MAGGLRKEYTRSSAMRLLQRAVYNAWDIPDDLAKKLPQFAIDLMNNATGERERLRAAELLMTMAKNNVELAAVMDKIERLEEGKPTENVDHSVKWSVPAPRAIEGQ